jgi:hypothetical protein
MRHCSLFPFSLSTCFLVLASACASQSGASASPSGAPTAQPPASELTTARSSSTAAPTGGEHDEAKPGANDSALVALLPSSKIGLAEGIALAERKGGTAISAKFELEDGKLSLSVYTAKAGIDADAEHNVLAELSGDPTQPAWQAKEQVFADIKHITRAAYHLTLVQRSRMSLASVIAKALAKQPGQVYAVEPGIHERSPVFHVAIATAGGGHVNVDVESGT